MDPLQRFGAIEAPSIVDHGSAWVPMGSAVTFVMRLPDNYHQATREALAHRPHTACGSRRSLAVVPLLGDQRYYGETPRSLRRDCRPSRGIPPRASSALCVTLTILCQYGSVLSLWLRLNSKTAPQTFFLRKTAKARLTQHFMTSCRSCLRKQLHWPISCGRRQLQVRGRPILPGEDGASCRFSAVWGR